MPNKILINRRRNYNAKAKKLRPFRNSRRLMRLVNSEDWICLTVSRRRLEVLLSYLVVLLKEGVPIVERIPRHFALPPIVVPISVFQKLEGLDLPLQPLGVFTSLHLGLLPLRDCLL